MNNYDFSPFLKQWIGFDKLASSIQEEDNELNLPQYNIEKIDDNNYRIVLSLSGFKKEELYIEIEGTKLTIKGKTKFKDKRVQYLHQGFFKKNFILSFTLSEHMKVKKADFNDGLLKIKIIRRIPESLQPRKIHIETQENFRKIS